MVLYVSMSLEVFDNGDRDDGKVLWMASPAEGSPIGKMRPYYKLGPKYIDWILEMIAKLEERTRLKLADQDQLERVVARFRGIMELMAESGG